MFMFELVFLFPYIVDKSCVPQIVYWNGCCALIVGVVARRARPLDCWPIFSAVAFLERVVQSIHFVNSLYEFMTHINQMRKQEQATYRWKARAHT